jgi:hypothetical protein
MRKYMKTIVVMGPPKAQPARRPRERKQSTLPPSEPTSGTMKRSAVEQKFLHNLANHVQILSLACFGLQSSQCEPWNKSVTKAINAIEASTQEMAQLVENFSKLLQDEASTKKNPTPEPSENSPRTAKNVYSISPYLKRRP